MDGILVRYYPNPDDHSKVEEDLHEMGLHIVVTNAGALDIRGFLGGTIKAYSNGQWIDAKKVSSHVSHGS